MKKKSTKSNVTKKKAKTPVKEIDVFDNMWEDKEQDNIYGLYGSENHSLGVTKMIYSGLPTMDKIIAVKRDTDIYGVPLNKIIELYGSESSGKTTLSIHLATEFIKNGGIAYFVDFEHKFDSAWAKTIAKNNGLSEEILEKNFRYVDPKHFEWFVCWLLKFMKKAISIKNEARREIIKINGRKKISDGDLELIKEHKKTIDKPFIVIVDSIAAIYTENEKKGEDESDITVAELARKFNMSLKHIRYYLGYTNILLLFTNQVRDKIETNPWLAKRGSKIKTPGGNAVKHFSDARLQISRVKSIKRTRGGISYTIGGLHIIKTVKNQMGPPPFSEAELKLLNKTGFFSFISVLDALVSTKKIKKTGSVYKFMHDNKIVEINESEADEVYKEHPEYGVLLHDVYKNYMKESKREE